MTQKEIKAECLRLHEKIIRYQKIMLEEAGMPEHWEEHPLHEKHFRLIKKHLRLSRKLRDNAEKGEIVKPQKRFPRLRRFPRLKGKLRFPRLKLRR